MKNNFSLKVLFFVLFQVFFLASTAHAKFFWDGSRTIQLNRLNTHEVSYAPTQFGYTVPVGSKITSVNVNMSGNQIDMISTQTFVCWNGITNCVQMFGKNMHISSFNGLDATRPIYVVIRVNGWGGMYPPAYVPTSVVVGYQ